MPNSRRPHSPDLRRRSARRAAVIGASLTLLALPAGMVRAVADGQAPAAPPAQGRGIQANTDHPVLAIGSTLPAFSLPGVDGKVHKSTEYGGTKVLAIVFESNHCPVSQLY